MNAPIRDAFDCSSRKPMRRHFVSGCPRALLSLSQEKSSGLEIGVDWRYCWREKEINERRSRAENGERRPILRAKNTSSYAGCKEQQPVVYLGPERIMTCVPLVFGLFEVKRLNFTNTRILAVLVHWSSMVRASDQCYWDRRFDSCLKPKDFNFSLFLSPVAEQLVSCI